MMDAGGARKREELFKMVNTNQVTYGIQNMSLNEGPNYTKEEKKVAMYGEKG